MNKLKQLILEQLNEIGEANLPIYPYENEIYTPTKILFIFNTEEDEYNVIFKKYRDFEWSISFNIAGDTHIETNKNNMYRVMSTITDIVNYFISIKQPILLSFYGTKTKGYNDERRNNLYVSYISKSSNKNYDLKKIDNEYFCQKIYNPSHRILRRRRV